jgi:hypothetical protein
LVRAAEKLQSWRQSGRLPADYRGIIASTDLANYCAWFAPLEKVYLNGNFNHHRKELPDYINIRGDLGLNYREGKPPDERAVGTLMNKVGAEYLAFASTQGETPNSRYLIALSAMRLWGDAEHWSPWFWDGRNAIGGWQADPSSKSSAFAALRLDPIELAFGPNVQRLPAETVRQLAPPEGWEGEFLHGVGMTPPGVDEAIGWQLYKESVQLRYYVGEQLAGQLMNACMPLPNESIMHRRMLQFLGYPNRPQPETLAAIPFLSLRAARRAIAADPDHPDGYFVLYQALSDPELPLTEVERTIGQVTALRQCLMRLPTPERFRPNIYRAQPHAIARALAVHYYGRSKEKGLPVTGLPLDAPAFIILAESPLSAGAMGLAAENGRAFSVLWKFKNEARQIIGGPTLRAVDLARETMDLARRYAEKELDPNKPAEAKMLKDLKDDCKGIEEEYIKRNSQYERDKSAAASSKAILVEQVRAALRSNLVGEALRILTDKATDLPKEYGARIFEIVLIRMSLEMLTGRLEEAAADMEEAPKVIDSTPLPPDAKPEAIAQYRAVSHLQLDQMEYQKLNFEGNYQGAGDLLERNSQQVGKDLPPDPAESAFKLSKAIVDLGFERVLNGFDYIPVASLAFLGREVMVADAMKPFVQRQQKLRNVRSEAADFYYRRGFLSLLEGDIPAAKKRFEQSRQPGIAEWGIPEQRSQSAERLLKLIEEAEKATAK